jgi:hypothetical protein
MAISKKGRRGLTVDDRRFLWWVCESQPECWVGEALTVVSEDRRFYVSFYLGQKPQRRFLVVEGRDFAGLPDAGGCWIRVQCPEWQSAAGIRPSDVRRLIDWSMSPNEPRARMDYRGELLAASAGTGSPAAE